VKKAEEDTRQSKAAADKQAGDAKKAEDAEK